MKKTIIITLIIALFTIAGIFIFNGNKNKVEDYTIIKSFNDVNLNNPTVVVLGREGCSWCKKMKTTLTTVSKEKDINIYYLDKEGIDESHNYEIPKRCADAQGQKLLDGFGTPLTLYFDKGKVIDCYSGYAEPDVYKAFLRKNELI